MLEIRLQQTAHELGQALHASPPVKAYLEAHAALISHNEATALLNKVAHQQNELRTLQKAGQLTKADIDTLRALQTQVQNHPIIQSYFQAQQELRTLLPQVNQEISQLLNVDFGDLARLKGGCC